MKEKYTQVRFESRKANDAKTMILHNTRCMNPHYIRDSMQHNKEKNTIIIFSENDIEKYEIQTKNKENQTDRHLRLLVNDILKKQLDGEVEYCKKQSKNYREKRNATVIDSIVTLSNDINDMYESRQITKQELNERFVKTVKNMERELGLKALNASIHYDEKTPHSHVSFRNYYNGRGISTKLKSMYKKAQDISALEFEDIGFRRGIEKNITNAKHLSVCEMHEAERKELELQVQKQKEEIESVNVTDIKYSNKFIDRDTIFFEKKVNVPSHLLLIRKKDLSEIQKLKNVLKKSDVSSLSEMSDVIDSQKKHIEMVL